MTVKMINGVVADSAETVADEIRVSVPNLTQADRQVHGPMAFVPNPGIGGSQDLPQRGDFALIAFDDSTQGKEWVVIWIH